MRSGQARRLCPRAHSPQHTPPASPAVQAGLAGPGIQACTELTGHEVGPGVQACPELTGHEVVQAGPGIWAFTELAGRQVSQKEEIVGWSPSVAVIALNRSVGFRKPKRQRLVGGRNFETG